MGFERSTPAGGFSMIHFSTLGASIQWFCPTSSVPACALYSSWKIVRGFGVARLVSFAKNLFSHDAAVSIGVYEYV